MDIKSVLIVYNQMKDGAHSLALEIEEKMKELDIQSHLFGYSGSPSMPHFDKADLAFVLGGDGTVLYTARVLFQKNVPILPINMGSIGFITEVNASEWYSAFIAYTKNKLSITKRIMLKVCVYRGGKEVAEFVGLNDGVIGATGASKIVRYQVDVNGDSLGEYRADGIIVSTPTGATGYSLAAGGPIIYPEAEALLVTPICPHSLTKRPIVIPGNEKIRIVLKEEQRTLVGLTVDGREEFLLQPGDEILFAKPRDKTVIVKSDKRSFYEVIRTKLGG